MSLSIATDHAAILYFARQYDRAIDQFLAVLERDPTFGHAYMVVWPYSNKGLFEQALSGIEKWRPIDRGPWPMAAEVYVYGRMGRDREARRELEKLEQYARLRPSDPMPMLPIAYIGVNDKEKALPWLDRSVRERFGPPNLRVDPIYDPLRADPRFRELLRRVGLA